MKHFYIYLLLFVLISLSQCQYYGNRGVYHNRDISGPSRNPESNGLREIYNWSQFDFNFPDNTTRQNAIRNGSFVPVNSSAPASIEVHGNRVFISLPRWKNGVPATLNTVPFPSQQSSPLLTPYPNWESNRQGNCEGLTSVYRMQVDNCNRLWVLDTGTVNSFVRAENICPVQVVAYDLNTDRVIHRYRLPSNVLRFDSQPVTIEVEYPGDNCGAPTDAVIYIADTVGYALIVVDLSTQQAWQIRDKSMFPSPEAGTFNVAGETFELMDGVLGLALSPEYTRPYRVLYFNAMSSFTQRGVLTQILRNQSIATRTPTAFKTAPYTRNSQSGDSAMDQNGVLFFGLLSDQSVGCWHIGKKFEQRNVVTLVKNDATLQFPVSLVVDQTSRLWVIATKFQSFFLGTQNPSETNYRIFMAPSTTELVRGTACQNGDVGIDDIGR